MNRDKLKDKLTDNQYQVVCLNGTEPPFQNEYWDNKATGVYLDVVSGKPLFLSTHKYDSGSGWPSFFQPVDANEIVEIVDKTHGMVRTEVRSKSGDAHLGHVFPDGPPPTGLRYCINSASLKFVPFDELDSQGLGHLKAQLK